MVSGSSMDRAIGVFILNRLVTHIQKHSSDSSNFELVVVSVEMSLAPEKPFPNGVVDCLSVADYIVKSSKSSIHVGGSSAGANLAALVALEIHRKYGPGKIKSALIHSPFFDPYTDSESYYLNSTSALVPNDWLRWCWRSYLQLGDGSFCNNIILNGDKAVHQMKELIDKSKWRMDDNIWRLVNPIYNIPDKIDDSNATLFLVVGCLADSLLDEALEFHKRIEEAGGNTKLIKISGSHATVIPAFDYQGDKNFYDAFAKCFDN